MAAMSGTAGTAGKGTTDVALLGTFQKHVEDMRNLCLCKICIKPFYEPYILACGHTYCYSCLASWFGGGQNRRRKRNCPDCRAEVTVQPSPNYLLRDLVHMFIGRAELLPEDETVQEHQQAKEDEAVLLAEHRGGPGLFRGAFVRRRADRFGLSWQQPVFDHEDHVMRCPECHWELEAGECLHCGFAENRSEDFSENASSGSDGDTEVAHSIVTIDSEADLDDMDDMDDSELERMMELDAGHDFDEYEDSDDFNESDDLNESDDDLETPISTPPLVVQWFEARENAATGSIDSPAAAAPEDDAQSDSTATLHAAPARASQRGRRVVLSDPDDSSDSGSISLGEESDGATHYDDTSDASEDDVHPSRRRAGQRRAPPIVISDDEDDDDDDPGESDAASNGSSNNSSEDDDTDPAEAHDEDDDDDDDDEADTSIFESDTGNPELLESAVGPPQPSPRRRQHRQNQRSRRVQQGHGNRSHAQRTPNHQHLAATRALARISTGRREQPFPPPGARGSQAATSPTRPAWRPGDHHQPPPHPRWPPVQPAGFQPVPVGGQREAF